MLQVSNQAVSKWEASQCCPDVTLLPQWADIFGVTMDTLFGREVSYLSRIDNVTIKSVLPWDDDDILRAVLYIGHRLIGDADIDLAKNASKVTFEHEGPALNIRSVFSVACDDVDGNINCAGNVNCGDVEGNVNSGGNVNCDDVEGNVNAERDVTCGDVGGEVRCGGNCNC